MLFKLTLKEVSKLQAELSAEMTADAVLDRRHLLRLGVAGTAAATLILPPSTVYAFAFPPLVASARYLIAQGVTRGAKWGLEFLASWWLTKKLDDWWERTGRERIGNHYSRRDHNSTFIGDITTSARPTVRLSSNGRDGTMSVDEGKFRKVITDMGEQWIELVQGRRLSTDYRSGREGDGLIVSPKEGGRYGTVYCKQDLDSGRFRVPVGSMLGYVGRKSNWVQVVHSDWRSIALSGSVEGGSVPRLGYMYMDARNLSWSDGQFARLSVNAHSKGERDDYFGTCKPAHVKDESCVD